MKQIQDPSESPAESIDPKKLLEEKEKEIEFCMQILPGLVEEYKLIYETLYRFRDNPKPDYLSLPLDKLKIVTSCLQRIVDCPEFSPNWTPLKKVAKDVTDLVKKKSHVNLDKDIVNILSRWRGAPDKK